MQEKRIRVSVIDDHRVFAEALAGRLSDEPDLEVVWTASAPAEAFELFSRNDIDVVVLDLDLAGEDGLAVGRQLRHERPDLAIVVVTAAADDSRAVEAVQMGVRGWVGKQGAIESLLTAVRGAARGEIHLPASILTRVLASLSERNRTDEPEAKVIAILTARELEVLQGLTEGLSRNQIGTLLDVSPNTVRTHIQSILHKLNVHTALAAAAFARRAGAVRLQDTT
jgi:DNA-binding NarL/FixJ family response regulator